MCISIVASLDFGARAGVELTLETAKELRAARPRDCRRRVRGSGSARQGRRAPTRSGGVARETRELRFLRLAEFRCSVPLW